jgi:hypothetical protein
MDGDGTDTLSTNGTWHFVDSPAILANDITFKSGRSIFHVLFCL